MFRITVGALLLACTLMVGAGNSYASEPDEDTTFTTARIKASLSLAAEARARHVYNDALERNKPMVIAVGCDRPDLCGCGDWAFVRKGKGFADIEHGVLVCQGRDVLKQLPCGADAAAVKKAFEEAKRMPTSGNIREYQSSTSPYAVPIYHTSGVCLPSGG